MTRQRSWKGVISREPGLCKFDTGRGCRHSGLLDLDGWRWILEAARMSQYGLLSAVLLAVSWQMTVFTIWLYDDDHHNYIMPASSSSHRDTVVSPLLSATPEYLLSQPSTSLCQTKEFSGFNTHWPSVSRYYLSEGQSRTSTYMVLVWEDQELTGYASRL